MTKLSLLGVPTTQNIEDMLLERLIYGEFASTYNAPYFNLWFLGDNGKVLPLHCSADWDEPLLKKLHDTISNQSVFNVQYIPMVEGVVFQRKDIKEVGKDSESDELYFTTGDIYSDLERRKIYRVKNDSPYITPYHMYIDEDADVEGVRALTREHVLRLVFFGVAL
jgi:hypothetical protein